MARRAQANVERQRPGETHLQWRSRLAYERDLREAAAQPMVTPEAMRHGAYEDGYTEVNGQRRAVKINRGGSTIDRWMSLPPDDVFGDAQRAAIRYCQKLWARLDYKGVTLQIIDDSSDGQAEHEALAELAALKIRLPMRYWNTYENICRFEHSATRRDTKTVVAFVASLIAMWRGL